LYLHKTKVDFYEKDIECLDDAKDKIILQGKKKPASVRMDKNMQVKHNSRKGCVLFTVHISSGKVKDVENFELLNMYMILQQFQDVFPIHI